MEKSLIGSQIFNLFHHSGPSELMYSTIVAQASKLFLLTFQVF